MSVIRVFGKIIVCLMQHENDLRKEFHPKLQNEKPSCKHKFLINKNLQCYSENEEQEDIVRKEKNSACQDEVTEISYMHKSEYVMHKNCKGYFLCYDYINKFSNN